MFLRRFKTWKPNATSSTSEASAGPADTNQSGSWTPPVPDNLVRFPDLNKVAPGATLDGTALDTLGHLPARSVAKGLLQEQPLVDFFARNYFAFGYHNGATSPSSGIMERGRREHVAAFQAILSERIESKQTKIASLEETVIAVESVCDVTRRQLMRACEHLHRQIGELQRQHDLASSYQGWVEHALSQYEAGFVRGMRAAVDFELMSGGS